MHGMNHNNYYVHYFNTCIIFPIHASVDPVHVETGGRAGRQGGSRPSHIFGRGGPILTELNRQKTSLVINTHH